MLLRLIQARQVGSQSTPARPHSMFEIHTAHHAFTFYSLSTHSVTCTTHLGAYTCVSARMSQSESDAQLSNRFILSEPAETFAMAEKNMQCVRKHNVV